MEREPKKYYEQRDDTANARHGIDLVKEIAARHEQELKKLLKNAAKTIFLNQ